MVGGIQKREKKKERKKERKKKKKYPGRREERGMERIWIKSFDSESELKESGRSAALVAAAGGNYVTPKKWVGERRGAFTGGGRATLAQPTNATATAFTHSVSLQPLNPTDRLPTFCVP